MESARDTLPEEPANGLTCGIDWARDDHAVSVVDARGHDHPHAVRILARAWLYIIWRCWHDGVAYNPTKHRALQALLQTQQQPAA